MTIGGTPFGASPTLVPSSEEAVFNKLYPATKIIKGEPYLDEFRLLQMLTEHTAKAAVILSTVSLLRQLYEKGKHSWGRSVLEIYQESLNIEMISLNRKGRIEATEIVAAVRRRSEDEED